MRKQDSVLSHTLKKIGESGISQTKELPILIPLTLSENLFHVFQGTLYFTLLMHGHCLDYDKYSSINNAIKFGTGFPEELCICVV